MARKRTVVLGGVAGGTITANRLRPRSDADEAEIYVLDRDDRHPVSITGGVTPQRPSRVWAGRAACA